MKHPPILRLLATLLLALTATAATAWEYYDFYVDGIYYNRNDGTSVSVTYDNREWTKYSGFVTIPSQVTYNGTTYSVTSIGSDAFECCYDLTSVTIPNSVTSIDYSAFSDCTGLTSVTIPNSVTKIGRYAFLRCRGLTSVTIPNSVTTIYEAAFSDCTGLTSVTIGNSVTSIGKSAFNHCSGLTSVTIPNSVTSIGDYAFWYCTGLTSVTIGNSVTKIGEYSFSDCTNLKSLTLGSALRSIYDYAFLNCPHISTIVIRAVDPPSFIGGKYMYYYFDDSVYNNAYLYVPQESVGKYKDTSIWYNNWAYFLHVVGKSNLGIDDASTDDETFSIEGGRLNCGGVYTEVYTLTGAKVYGGDGEVELPAGAYIVEANGRATKVYIK